MVANGHIVTLSSAGLCKVGASTDPLFITYNDPLKTMFNGDKFYATNLGEEHVRAVQLIPGDEWMSDIDYLSSSTSGQTTTWAYPGGEYLASRIIKIDDSTNKIFKSDEDWFGKDTLPDGTKAYHYIFVK